MTEYEKIRRQCLKRGELYEDPEFPATQSSVFYHQTPPFQFVWKRPKELAQNPCFIKEGSATFDVIPGKLGDRWLVSCLGCLFLNKGFFYRVVPADQTFEDQLETSTNLTSYTGVFRFRLWWCGEWVEVTIDDRLPTVNGRLVFAHSQALDQFWPSLLEKAYAKLHGSYEALKYGSTLDGLADLTGGVTESVLLKNEASLSAASLLNGRFLTRLLCSTSLVTLTVQNAQTNASRSSMERLPNGIITGINYKVCGVEKVDTVSNEPIYMAKLKCSLGESGESLTAWSRSAEDWDNVPSQERERLNPYNLPDGEFWMTINEILRTFTHLELVHLDAETSKDEPSLSGKQPWTTRVYQGTWQKGVTAGGCRNNADTFHINPQLHLILSDSDEVVISVCQHTVLEPKVIGFSVYPLAKLGVESIGKSFFKRNKSLVNSQYSNSRQVSQRCLLDQGGYLIVPTTFEPGQEASFTLRVFSSQALKLKSIDTVPTMLKSAFIKAAMTIQQDGRAGLTQYEAVFMQLADEHRSVNAFELQELLEACLPNDYIKSCASIEVCRQVVLAFDTVGLGRLKISDFRDFMASLKGWQSVFKAHTKEKTGILRAERFKDALLDIGFQINNDVLSILMLKYMRKDGTLRFGDFVSAIIHMHSAFGAFERRDPLQNGTIKISLSEWLRTTLTC